MKKSLILGSVVLNFLISPSAAQTPAGAALTWRDCVREVLKNNPDLISAAESVHQFEADKQISRSSLLPQITSEVGAQTSKSGSQDRVEKYSYSVRGQQLLFDGFKTSHAVGEADSKYRAAQYNYMVVSSNLRLNLMTTFAQLLRAQDMVPLAEAIVTRRQQNLHLVRLRYDAGREHKGSLLTAEADLANAEYELEQAVRNLSYAQVKLAQVLGWDHRIPLKVTGEFLLAMPDRELPDLQDLADTTPFLLELAAQKDAARHQVKSSQAEFFPKVYLNASLGRSAEDWPPEDNNWAGGVSVSFPFFEGGSRGAGVVKSKSLLKRAEAEERSGRDTVILTLEESWVGWQDAVGAVAVRKKFLEADEERAKIANAQYAAGLIAFDDWIIIEDNLVNSQKAYLNTQANVLVAQATWAQAKGEILEHE
ncbi:MAG TPA: TolC family protein [Candidatus Omnitrophota bacterium]|nr:TolC family protein [Candidatus Omnitrophota bacterium]HPB69118.1 TolC family protein [Candidatus Omnitrophota bacterium]HQO58204.1 TolC family protein [Candidatus Omnitrophota bacterium]